MYAVLAFLRTIICSGVAFVVWWVLSRSLGADSLVSVMVPVWVGGIVGGAVCSIFNARQGITLAFTCGVLLTAGFLYVRHGLAGIPLGQNTLLTLWPLWFPPAFYGGAYGYILLMRRFS
ncbi:MAG: hypothetical protein GKR90_00675 [Pseudomonadales bacterium]|nr:hypothetical protein [Pseudomonadales bacterium]